MAMEDQRYGRDKSSLVNKTYIDGGDYRNKFDYVTYASFKYATKYK